MWPVACRVAEYLSQAMRLSSHCYQAFQICRCGLAFCE